MNACDCVYSGLRLEDAYLEQAGTALLLLHEDTRPIRKPVGYANNCKVGVIGQCSQLFPNASYRLFNTYCRLRLCMSIEEKRVLLFLVTRNMECRTLRRTLGIYRAPSDDTHFLMVESTSYLRHSTKTRVTF
jgi:hypothetical protein